MPLALSVAAKKSLRHAPPSSTCFFGLLVAYYIESQPGRCIALRDHLLGVMPGVSAVRDGTKRLFDHGHHTAMRLCCDYGSRESGQTYETILGVGEHASAWPDVRLCK